MYVSSDDQIPQIIYHTLNANIFVEVLIKTMLGSPAEYNMPASPEASFLKLL
jgi:hypothetical protein